MAFREMLPLTHDNSILIDAMQELVDASKACPMTRAEHRVFVEFVSLAWTHGYLYKLRAIEDSPGFRMVVTPLPGYLRLMDALRAGAPSVMNLIVRELAQGKDCKSKAY